MNNHDLEQKLDNTQYENDDGLWPRTDLMRYVSGVTLAVTAAAGMLYGIYAAHKREYAAMSPRERKTYDIKQKRGPLVIIDLAEGFLHNWGGVPHQYPWDK
jgi:hypothetical protein